jgi:hypothetical protein
MWRPKTEADIKVGIESGTTVETSSFDAKRELPGAGKNKDLAKDICAMTVNGGTLLYGLGGDNPTRPNELCPFPTAGVRERIDSVIHSGIEEPPAFEVYEIDSEDQPGKGYVYVVVPASPRAPHMLKIDGDGRFWSRGDTGNRILGEGEIARLYERRTQIDVQTSTALDEATTRYPFEFEPASCGVSVARIRPVAAGRDLLRVAAGDSAVDELLMRDMTEAARARDPYPDQGTAGLGEAFSVRATEADLWVATRQTDLSSEYQAYAEFSARGAIAYWHSPLVNTTRGGVRLLMERSLTRAVYQPLAVAAWLYERAGFYGSTDVGVAALGIGGIGGGSMVNAFGREERVYAAAEYRRWERVSGEELRDGLDGVVRRLLRPLYEVISVRNYEPLRERDEPRRG